MEPFADYDSDSLNSNRNTRGWEMSNEGDLTPEQWEGMKRDLYGDTRGGEMDIRKDPMYRLLKKHPNITLGESARLILDLEESLSVLRRIFVASIKTDDCIEWTGAKNGCGYGNIRIGGHRTGKTGVVSTIIGRICVPGDGCVLHKCDNPACFNPRHLYRGTMKQNAKDRELRSPFNRRGSNNGHSRLTEDDIANIRFLRRAGHKRKDLAVQFSVSVHTIDDIVYRRKWKHVL